MSIFLRINQTSDAVLRQPTSRQRQIAFNAGVTSPSGTEIMRSNRPILTYRGTVYPWHCDHVGHMNVMWYVGKFDEATWSLFHEIGLTSAYLRKAGRGMAAVEQRIFYLRELHAGAVVSVRSTVIEARQKLLVFSHDMTIDDTGEIAARTELKGVHLDQSTRKSCVFAPHILAKAAELAASDAHADSGNLPDGSQT